MRVFVSSTFSDLREYRRVAEHVIVSLGHEAEMVGALSGLNEEQVAHACAEKAESCDACVLILGFRLGSEPSELKAVERGLAAYQVGSFTSIELRAVQRAELPILAYVLEESELSKSVRASEDVVPIRRRERRVANFRRDVANDHLVRFMAQEPEAFRTALKVDLFNLGRAQQGAR